MGACSSAPQEVPTKQDVWLSLVDARLKLDRISNQLEHRKNIVETPPPRGFESLEHTMLIPVYIKLKELHKRLDKVVEVSSTL